MKTTVASSSGKADATPRNREGRKPEGEIVVGLRWSF